MKKFLLRVACFSALLVGSVMALVVLVIVLNRRALPNCRLQTGTNAIVVGDSHPKSAIDDADIPGLRNISLNAEGYKYTYAKLQHLFRTEPSLKKVYVGFSYHNLSGYYDEYIYGRTFKFYVERYLSVLTADDYLVLAKTTPLGVPGLMQRILQRGLPTGSDGQCQLYGSFTTDETTETFRLDGMKKRIRSQYFPEGPLVAPSASNLLYLGKIVDLARAQGREVVMLNTPLHPAYLAEVPPAYRQLYQRFLTEKRLEAFDFPELRLGDQDFLPDGDHINARGAVLTTKAFKDYHAGH